MTTNNVYDHAAVIHSFVLKCMSYFIEDLDFDEREQLEQDLPEYAISIDHAGGYNLDQQIAALVAERDALRTENERLRTALQQIADGNPAPPGGKWLSDAKMAQIALRALSDPPTS